VVTADRGSRRSFRERSQGRLAAAAARPRWMLPVLAAALLVTGLASSGPMSFVALVAVAVLLAWLAMASWPIIDPQGRLLRVAAVLVLLAVAVTRL